MPTLLCLSTLLHSSPLHAQPATRTLIEWTFDEDLEGWGQPNHVSDLRVEEGALQGRIMDWDPFIRSPEFEVPATPWQTVEFRLKTDCGGGGEVFWTNTTESPYGGFSPGKETPFTIIGDGEWHVYRVRPYWHVEGKIILLRLDLARPETADNGKKTFAVDYLRIVEPTRAAAPEAADRWDFAQGTGGWTGEGAEVRPGAAGLEVTVTDSRDGMAISPPLRVPLGERAWVSIRMAVDREGSGRAAWVSSEHSGLRTSVFPLRADGRVHTYNLDLSSSGTWAGDLLLLGLTPVLAAGGKATIESIVLVEDPLGAPEVEVTYAGLEEAINRAGHRLPFIINLLNRGGEAATDLRIADLELPPNVSVADERLQEVDWRQIAELEPFDPAAHRLYLSASAPVRGQVTISLAGQGAPSEPIKAEVVVEPSLDLPKADYVPEPRPVESDYEIGALYFPGWESMTKWDPIQRIGPERKPVLGWYDEGNPECVDWQIKWAVEHGIGFFMVDWYWSAGGRSLEHWVQAFQKARHRRYLKWCMMWANHNAPNTHSEADQRAVTQYWLDHYFGTPEYYRIDDMPVVMIWSPANMEHDLAGQGGAKRLLDISQEMARGAGYKGIYFVAMKWSEGSTDPALIQSLKDMGFSMTSIYHYMESGGKAENPYRFPFQLCVDSTYPFFKAWHEADILPFLPNLATGWDSRPWHGDSAQVIHGRTVELFRRLCEDAKRFADETGVKRMVLAPLNEWGEGSYAEPCKEFGFGMYDAVRDTFCRKPAGGWPLNIAPADVGLGPYDYPGVTQRTTWDFTNGAQGWTAMMGIGSRSADNGVLTVETTTFDPAITCGLPNLQAAKYPYFVIRMKIDRLETEGEMGQLFWSTAMSGTSEASSAKWTLIGDGEYHTYTLRLADNLRWRGRIVGLRLDPCNHEGATVSIEGIRLSAEGE